MAALIAGAMIVLMNAMAGAAQPIARWRSSLLGCVLALLLGGLLGGAHGLLITAAASNRSSHAGYAGHLPRGADLPVRRRRADPG
jgi:hypothetical protein